MVREVGQLLVVDNGLLAETKTLLQSWSELAGTTVVTNPGNRGLAAALNQGMQWAQAEGCDWAVTFDQDSTPLPGLVAALLASAQAAGKVAVVGSRTFDESTGRQDRWLCPAFFGFRRVYCGTEDLTGITFVITSGSLTSVRAWSELGGFDAGLFIDYVDHDFCLKARHSGWKILVSARAALAHNLGAHREVVFAGRKLYPTFHNATRHYYMARNRILMWRRHAWTHPHWWLFDACFGGVNIVRILLAEDQRAQKFAAMLSGTWDALCGRNGPRSARNPRTMLP